MIMSACASSVSFPGRSLIIVVSPHRSRFVTTATSVHPRKNATNQNVEVTAVSGSPPTSETLFHFLIFVQKISL